MIEPRFVSRTDRKFVGLLTIFALHALHHIFRGRFDRNHTHTTRSVGDVSERFSFAKP